MRDHSREAAGLTYVYPVLSRRADGLSIGINLNPNNACNWRCIYCQVPNLVRGNAPPIDQKQLAEELRGFLHEVVYGDFYQRSGIPEDQREIRDIAFSGNGEPTSAKGFAGIVALVQDLAADFDLLNTTKLVLITNGSLVHRAEVQQGLKQLARTNGVVWFKLDSATRVGMQRINNSGLSLPRVLSNLQLAASLCPTWIQTCVFALDGQEPSADEQQAYLRFLMDLRHAETPIQGVLLYGLARRSWQAEAPRLSALPLTWLETFADKIRCVGFVVSVSV